MPDFLNYVNLKHVKLCYSYIINHGSLLLVPLLLAIFATQIPKLITWENQNENPGLEYWSNLLNFSAVLGSACFVLYVYLNLTPRSTYLLNFACFRPPNDLKISKEEYIELAKKSGKFSDAAIEFQENVLKNSGLGDSTYLPRVLFQPDHNITLKDGREEAEMLMFGAVDELLAATRISPKAINILIVNCGILNPTPSLSAMLVYRYRLSSRVQSFNLGGMGCAAGIVAIDLAKDLLAAHPSRRSYALVVSFEALTSTWYDGEEIDMLLPNCFFRLGSSAILLSNRRSDRWRAKYELKQLARTHKAIDTRSFMSMHGRQDGEGKKGLSVNKHVTELGGYALKDNVANLGPLVLPVSDQILFFLTSFFFGRKSEPYIQDYKRVFEHVCILAAGKKVLDEAQKSLELSDEYMEASRKTLERFGNTSSSSVWYQLAYLEAKKKVKMGDRVCQIAFGSGLKCNSVVWKALGNVAKQHAGSPWMD